MKSYDTSFGKIKVKKDGAVSIEFDLKCKIASLSAEVVEQLAINHKIDAYGEVADWLTSEVFSTLSVEKTSPLSVEKTSPLYVEIKNAFIQILRDL